MRMPRNNAACLPALGRFVTDACAVTDEHAAFGCVVAPLVVAWSAPGPMDTGSLAAVIGTEGGEELAEALESRLAELNALSIGGAVDKKALLSLLKEAGCVKMGVRQRVAGARAEYEGG